MNKGMLNKVMGMVVLVFGGFVLVGCGGVPGEKVDSADSVVGTWRRVGGGHETHCRFSGDGTWTCDDSLDNVLTGNEFNWFNGEYWFEGTRYFEQITNSRGGAASVSTECSEVGEYEIYIQSSGNLRYELIKDECTERINRLNDARGIYEGEIEWARVS
jgi:hypothetical protein